jgi:peptidoglycan/xylan/chitin deacetylase (PgdA/CDA1 family)
LPHLRRFCILCLALLCAVTYAAAEPFEHPYPEALQIRVETEVWPSAAHGDVLVDLPVTSLESVNSQLREAAQALFAQTAEYADCRIDMPATYRISGTKWAGFLLAARAVRSAERDSFVVEDTAALYFDVKTYDMETGKALTLRDVFAETSSAWTKLADAALTLLLSYYPGEARDETALNAMLSPEALSASPFLPCAGRLLVPFKLQDILPNHPQIAWLTLPYPDYRGLMRPQAMLQTDNSTRPMIALTFDDGPARVYTQEVLTALARYGASASFFCVGNTVIKQPDLLRREMDFGHTAGAHSMSHQNSWEQSAQDMQKEFNAQKRLFTEMTGLPAALLRPQGGDAKTYIARRIGWPLITWNKSGSDTGPIGTRTIASHVAASVGHGDIVLLHDTKEKTAAAVPLILAALQERGYMFAAVDELLYLNGVTPEPDVDYANGLGQSAGANP